MEIKEIRVKNFRTIEHEQSVVVQDNITVVGANNSGKTNFLKAIKLLFTGFDNSYGYKKDSDLTFDAGRVRTSIIATFDGDPRIEKDIYDDLDELHKLQGTARSNNSLSLSLYFTDTDTPVYSLFPNIKRPQDKSQAAQYSRLHIALVNKVLGKFSLHYIPSAKSVDQIYNEILVPFLIKKVSSVIEPYVPEINSTLASAAESLNDELSKSGLKHLAAGFSLPSQSIEKLISGFDFIISDPQSTPVHEKGMGIQTIVLLAAFRWITKQEVAEGKNVIWLLEEPESYLHPELSDNCSLMLDSLSEESTVIKTTHSMAFVPQDPDKIFGTYLNENGRTEIKKFESFSDAVSSIRSSLGVKFSHFYNLSSFNVMLEGPSDKEIFSWFIKRTPAEYGFFPFLSKAFLEDFGGVKHLGGFLRATYQFIRKECPCVAIFDGDAAGVKERSDLQNFFGRNGIAFEPNKHFVSIRSGFAVEGLFPDDWIIDIYEDHSAWFQDYSVDVSGNLEPFRIKDDKKSNVQKILMDRAEAQENSGWASKFNEVCSAIDKALEKQSKSLNKNGVC